MHKLNSVFPILIITIILSAFACKDAVLLKDDELSMQRKDYMGNELRVDGYYFLPYDSDKMLIYFFYRDGTLLHAGGGYETNKINEYEQRCKSSEFAEKAK